MLVRILDAREKPIENLFAFIHRGPDAGRWHLRALSLARWRSRVPLFRRRFAKKPKGRRRPSAFLQEEVNPRISTRPLALLRVSPAEESARGSRWKGTVSPRAFVDRVWISGPALSGSSGPPLRLAVKRWTRAAESFPARPLSESIFASLDAYFRSYLHVLDNAGAAGDLAWESLARDNVYV